MTKEEIIEILNKYSRYIDRSAFDKAVLHFQFNDVADEIISKLHQPTVSGCSHPQVVRCNDGYTYCQLCSKQTYP